MGEKWFSERLINWYSENKRELPWRTTVDPYKIWLSEIILQQTRVEQGLPYYNKFILAFPSIEDLASAPEDKVLRLWQGLGYYSRARNLQVAAKYIVNHLNGVFPKNFKDLLLLKGVGQYTAAAIASFSYGESVAVVDGNVYRVLSRIFNDSTDISSGKGQKHFFSLASELIDPQKPAVFNQAIMEFGALFCTPKSPNCEICIFNDKCSAFGEGNVEQLPYKKAKIKVSKLYLKLFVLKYCKAICLVKRDNSSIWKGLYEFPNMIFDAPTKLNEDQINEFLSSLGVDKYHKATILGEEKMHKLSHRTLYAEFYEVDVEKFSNKLTSLFYKTEKLKELPKPVLIDKILNEYYF